MRIINVFTKLISKYPFSIAKDECIIEPFEELKKEIQIQKEANFPAIKKSFYSKIQSKVLIEISKNPEKFIINELELLLTAQELFHKREFEPNQEFNKLMENHLFELCERKLDLNLVNESLKSFIRIENKGKPMKGSKILLITIRKWFENNLNVIPFTTNEIIGISYFFNNLNIHSKIISKKLEDNINSLPYQHAYTPNQKLMIIVNYIISLKNENSLPMKLLEELINSNEDLKVISKSGNVFVTQLCSIILENTNSNIPHSITLFNQKFMNENKTINLSFKYLQSQIGILLKMLDLEFKEEIKICGLVVDFLIEDKIVLEVYGPSHYSFENDVSTVNMKTFLREEILLSKGFQVATINYSTFYSIKGISSRLSFMQNLLFDSK